MLRNENDDARVMRLFSELEEKVVELLLNESSPPDIKKQEKKELNEAIRLSTIDIVRRREALVKAHNKVVSCWQPQKKMLCGLHSMHVVLCALSGNTDGKSTREKYTLDVVKDTYDKHICQLDPDYVAKLSRNSRDIIYEGGLDSYGQLNADTIQVGLTTFLNKELFEVRLRHEHREAFGNTVAIIAGTVNHFMAFVKIDGFWFNADSLNREQKMKTPEGDSIVSPLRLYSEQGVHDYLKERAVLHLRVVRRANSFTNRATLTRSVTEEEKRTKTPGIHIFTASWCGHCNQLKQDAGELFEKRALKNKSHKTVPIIHHEWVADKQTHEKNSKIWTQYGMRVSGFPTIYRRDEKGVELYKGERETDDIIAFYDA